MSESFERKFPFLEPHFYFWERRGLAGQGRASREARGLIWGLLGPPGVWSWGLLKRCCGVFKGLGSGRALWALGANFCALARNCGLWEPIFGFGSQFWALEGNLGANLGFMLVLGFESEFFGFGR